VDLHEDTDTRAIDNFIVRLRRYIEPEPSNRATLLRFEEWLPVQSGFR
jgi:DNA-binding response OmpR family regulator